MKNLANYIKTELDHPPAHIREGYILPNGHTDWASRLAFEAGWYQAEATRLARSCKALEEEIDRLTSKA